MSMRYHTPLTAEEQLAAGLPAPRTLALADRVRYAELDPLNHVNNKSYFTWFETLRVEYGLRCVLPFFDVVPRMVLRGGEVRFHKEMLEGEDYIATAHVTAFRASSYTIEQLIWAGDLRASFNCVMVMLCPDGAERMPLPDALRDTFLDRDGAQAEA